STRSRRREPRRIQRHVAHRHREHVPDHRGERKDGHVLQRQVRAYQPAVRWRGSRLCHLRSAVPGGFPMTAETDLLACPFCGGVPRVVRTTDVDDMKWAHVECYGCGARTRGDWAS